MIRPAALLLAFLLAPLAWAQPTATTQALGPLSVEIDGAMRPLVPLRAAARGDGFLLLAKRADGDAFDNPLVVLQIDASGAIAGHRVLSGLGNALGAPTRLQTFGDELVFAVQINDPEAESPVRIVALRGLEHRELVSVPLGASYKSETPGSLEWGFTTTSTHRGFRLTDVVPLAQDLFLVTGQSSIDVTSMSDGDAESTPVHDDSQPMAALVNTAGETRPLAVPDDGYGMVLGAAGQGSEFMAVYWTGPDAYGHDDLFVSTFDAQFEPGDAFRLSRPSYGFSAIYPWGEGFLIYGQRGVDGERSEDAPARLYLTLTGGRPASGGTRGVQNIEIGQDLPRDGGEVRFSPAFLGSLDDQR